MKLFLFLLWTRLLYYNILIFGKLYCKMLRNLVSGHRRRFTQDGYDLDLSYITPRILAMGIPARGVETLWRNAASEVARMLDAQHGAGGDGGGSPYCLLFVLPKI